MRDKLLNCVVGLAAIVVLAYSSAMTNAGDLCCSQCGCQDCCKVCRLVPEDKKVPVVCWGLKCEDVCLAGPSCRGCKNCEEVCQSSEKGADGPCVAPQNFVWYDWIPGCSKGIYTKKRLMRKTVTKTVPSFKWVVEDLCSACEAKLPPVEVPFGADIPPRPLVPSK